MPAGAWGIMLAACPLAAANTVSTPGFVVSLPRATTTAADGRSARKHVFSHVYHAGNNWLRRMPRCRVGDSLLLGAGGAQGAPSPMTMVAGGVLVDAAGAGAVAPVGGEVEGLGEGEDRDSKK